MTPGQKKLIAICLALFVSLLPFRFSYALPQSSTDSHVAPHQHSFQSGCTRITSGGECAAVTGNAQTGDQTGEKCCSHHCDSSFGAQICIDVGYRFQIPSGRLYPNTHRVWTPGPVPPTLLHPPSTFA